MKKTLIWFLTLILITGLIVSFSVIGCKEAAEEEVEEAAEEAAPAVEEAVEEEVKEMRKVKVGMSSFQDVMSIYVGIEQGFYEEAGIEFDITNSDWAGANELLVGGHVEMATSCDQNNILQNAVDQDTTLAFPFYFFAGSGFVYDPMEHPDWKNINSLLEETDGDFDTALNMLLEQLWEDDAVIGISKGGEYVTYSLIVNQGGYDPAKFETVDMANEDLPPALIAGSLDVMISGIPPRLAAQRQGCETLIDASYFPNMVNHAGFAASRAWIDANFDLAVDIQKAMFKTLDFIEKNPDIGLPVISNKLKEAGADVSPEELKLVWNSMEYFPNSKEQFQEWVIEADSKFYWKERYQKLVDGYIEEGQLEEGKIENLEDLYYGLKVVDAIE